MANTDNNLDARYPGIHEGVVVDNRDPEGLLRVRVRVDGLTPDEGSTWAYPMASPGGGAGGRGFWDAADIGAEVYVWFLNGDPEKVRWQPGHWARGEEPSAVKAAKAEATTAEGKIDASLQVKVWETSDWQIVVDERPGKRRCYINSKSLGEDLETGNALMVELDREQGVVTLSGTGGIALRSTGLIDISASSIQIGGRKVTQGITKPI